MLEKDEDVGAAELAGGRPFPSRRDFGIWRAGEKFGPAFLECLIVVLTGTMILRPCDQHDPGRPSFFRLLRSSGQRRFDFGKRSRLWSWARMITRHLRRRREKECKQV